MHFGLPWGLIGAIVLVIGVELALRGIGRMKLIAFASDEGQYHAVRDIVDAQGPAEVALVGSSQLREGVTMPVLLDELAKDAGRPVWAANYSMRGARVDVIDAAVRYLLRQSTPPKLIVVGMSVRDLRASEPDWPRDAIFWSPRDWLHELPAHPQSALSVLPVVVRSEIGRGLWTLRYREEISLWSQRLFTRFGVDANEDTNPILGEPTFQHIGTRGFFTYTRGLVPLHKQFDRVRDSYLMERKAKMPKQMIERLGQLSKAFARSPGLWIEMPVAKPLAEWLTHAGQPATFAAAVQSAAAAAGIDFLPVESEPQMGDVHFRDLQHLNRIGAEIFSKWLAGEIVKRLADHPSTQRSDHSGGASSRK